MWIKRFMAWLLKYRVWVLLVFLAITVLSAFALPRLKYDFSPEAMLDYSEEELNYEASFAQKFGSTHDSFLIVLKSNESLISSRGLEAIRDLTEYMAVLPEVTYAYSLTRAPDNDMSLNIMLGGGLEPMIPAGPVTSETLQKVKSRVETSSILSGNLISKDERHALILLNFDEKYREAANFEPVLDQIEKRVSAWNRAPEHQFEIAFGGLPYIRTVTVSTMKSEQLMLWPLVGLFYFFALVLLFRNVMNAALPLISVGAVVLWAIAVMVLFEQPVTMINNTLPLLILVIGVTNSIYILVRILDERAKGKDKRTSIIDGVSRVALASFLTTSTTAIGFGSLIIAHAPILVSFGAIIAFSVLLIYVVIVTMMPLIASFFPLKAKRMDVRDYVEANGDSAAEANVKERRKIDPLKAPTDKSIDGWIELLSASIARFAIKHNKLVIAFSIVILVGSTLLGLRVPLDSKVNDVFESSHSISQANRMIEEELGGILPLEIDIYGEAGSFRKAEILKSIADLQTKVANVDGVIVSLSLINILQEAGIHFDQESLPTTLALNSTLMALKRLTPEQLDAFMTQDASNIHISVRMPDDGVRKSLDTIKGIRAACEELVAEQPSLSYRFTGTAYTSTMGLEAFVNDLFSSLLMAFFIIFLVLFIAFRSFWSGLASALPNILPLVMTLAMMNVYSYELNTTSVLVFTISIGLAVDNSIHIISRFRQEYRFGRSVDEAIIRAMRSSGRAILQSNTLLISGLAILLFSSFEPISRVGVLTMTTIGAALLVAIVVIPAELKQIGHRMKLKETPRVKL
ncbi:MAG: efflux RND transporter permease subunit [Bradymonadia bacterium]|jgi:predicted RND superfamily exporter protein